MHKRKKDRYQRAVYRQHDMIARWFTRRALRNKLDEEALAGGYANNVTFYVGPMPHAIKHFIRQGDHFCNGLHLENAECS